MKKYTYPYFESIKIQNRHVYNWDRHAARIRQTIADQHDRDIELSAIQKALSQSPADGLYNATVWYDITTFEIEYTLYTKRKINTLRIVFSDYIEYPYKLSDRALIDSFSDQLAQHEDILIVKNGLITDGSYCNLAFFKSGLWYTPAQPLLKGTRRETLLEEKKLIEEDIHWDDIGIYEKVSCINAMLDLNELCISTNNIYI